MNKDTDNPYAIRDICTMPFATNVKELLVLLRQYPGLMGSHLTVSHLSSFIDGFAYCRRGIAGSADWEHMESFGQWVHNYYKSTITVGWSSLIESATADDESSLLIFWKLYDGYLESLSSDSL